MNILSAENIAKSYGDKYLFQNLTFGLSRGDKVAIVGANGTGKSTLLSILAGLQPPDEGIVSIRKDVSVGVLEQQPHLDDALTVLETVLSGENSALLAIREYELALESGNHDRLDRAMQQMDTLQAWDFETQMKQVLGVLGIHDVTQRVGSLSGGQRKRVALARVIIENPELIILDEPTNHLDLETIEWLENYLTTQNQTLLMVSHDRYFLDKVCNQIVELDRQTLFSYKGNYAYYLEKKEEREAIAAAEIDKAKNLYRRELDWMRRQPKARGTKAQYRIDAFEDVKDKAHQKLGKSELELNIRTQRLGSKIIELENVSKRYGEKVLLDHFTYTFRKADRIGIIGKNGMGKTTLLNMINNEVRPDSGKIITGGTVKIGYYTQSDLDIPENMRVIDVVQEVAEVMKLGTGETVTASQFLQHFLFDRKKQYDFVHKLSGGEKRRLQLLLVLVQNPNFLILDEPTNDLDITTLNVLEEFLLSFPGCILLVSHDRYFMDRLVEHTFVFEGEGKIRDYPGNYTDYREWKAEQPKVSEAADRKPETKAPATETAGAASTPPPAKKKLSFKEQKEYELLEKEIEELEQRKSGLLQQLNSGSSNHEQLTAWAREIEEVDAQLSQKSDRWLELAEFI
ncbi:ABC-F family ATP-binding cassette domain-containing protein [Tellurirhabdus rosea]|uniref:ABC-F family ATP-binding cassette domain-containing protein n=1 Tax=Tellurirhabdus rosea TaxID=2674997 RepID=UPI00224CEA9D|nr:ABC-F family ATP-binding cassette domain-containing protein [Tellurirhabdus rosea]